MRQISQKVSKLCSVGIPDSRGKIILSLLRKITDESDKYKHSAEKSVIAGVDRPITLVNDFEANKCLKFNQTGCISESL